MAVVAGARAKTVSVSAERNCETALADKGEDMGFLWTYVLGPVLALSPKRWRDALGSSVGARSRLLESASGIVALVDCYLYGMGKMVDAGVDSALHGDLGVTDQQIGGASYVVLMTHPITWVLAFFAAEGVVRLCAAAFSESVVATLPLAMVD
jgi:hypothetical protein